MTRFGRYRQSCARAVSVCGKFATFCRFVCVKSYGVGFCFPFGKESFVARFGCGNLCYRVTRKFGVIEPAHKVVPRFGRNGQGCARAVSVCGKFAALGRFVCVKSYGVSCHFPLGVESFVAHIGCGNLCYRVTRKFGVIEPAHKVVTRFGRYRQSCARAVSVCGKFATFCRFVCVKSYGVSFNIVGRVIVGILLSATCQNRRGKQRKQNKRQCENFCF